MPTDTFKSLIKRAEKVQKTLGSDGRTKIAVEAAKKVIEAQSAVVASSPLGGDRAFSHWTRKSKITLETFPKVIGPGEVKIGPKGKSAGPWTVAERGRQSYGKGDVRKVGTYTSKKTGQTKVRTRKVSRAVGGHGGWGVASKAVDVAAKVGPLWIEQAAIKAFMSAFG